MDDASLPQDQNIGGDPMGSDPNGMGGDPMGSDPNGMGGDQMGSDPNGMGGDQMGGDPNGMDEDPMGDNGDEGVDDEKVKYGTSIFKGLTPDNQDAAIAYMQSMEDREDDNANNEQNSEEMPQDGEIPQDDGQGDAEQGQPLMEIVLTKHQVKKLSEELMQTDTKNNERDERLPLDKKQSKGMKKSPFNSPKFN